MDWTLKAVGPNTGQLPFPALANTVQVTDSQTLLLELQETKCTLDLEFNNSHSRLFQSFGTLL